MSGEPIKSKLEIVYDTTPEHMQSMIRTLFLWMYDHDVNQVTIKRNDKTALISLDSECEKGIKP